MWNSPDRRTSSECHGATTNGDGTKGIAINRRSVVQVHVSSSTFDALLEEEVSLWTTVCDQFFVGVLFWNGFFVFCRKTFSGLRWVKVNLRNHILCHIKIHYYHTFIHIPLKYVIWKSLKAKTNMRIRKSIQTGISSYRSVPLDSLALKMFSFHSSVCSKKRTWNLSCHLRSLREVWLTYLPDQ